MLLFFSLIFSSLSFPFFSSTISFLIWSSFFLVHFDSFLFLSPLSFIFSSIFSSPFFSPHFFLCFFICYYYLVRSSFYLFFLCCSYSAFYPCFALPSLLPSSRHILLLPPLSFFPALIIPFFTSYHASLTLYL